MEFYGDFVKALIDPNWWLPNIVLILIALVLPSVFKKIQATSRRYARHNRIKGLKRAKALRWDSLQIVHVINRAAANYVIFVVLIVLYLYLIIFTPFIAALKSVSLAALVASPIYFFQIRWLILDSLAKEAIRLRRRVRRLRGLA